MHDPRLQQMWRTYQEAAFPVLRLPSGLGFVTPDVLATIGSHNDLAVTTRAGLMAFRDDFQPSWAILRDPEHADFEREAGRLHALQVLLVHEMVHQSLHQAGTRHDHDQPFIDEANRVQPLLPDFEDYPTADEGNASYWPCPIKVLRTTFGF